MARGLTSREVCRRVGVTYRVLDHWTRRGLVRPSITEAKGTGSQRRWAEIDVQRVAIVKLLRDAGIGLETIRLAMSAPSHLGALERSARRARELLEHPAA